MTPESRSPADKPVGTAPDKWLNRNVVGMGVTSFLSDAGHEMATSVFPSFLTAIGAPAAALGTIEGVADGASSFVRLAAGWQSDRTGRRKAAVTAGYSITAMGTGLLALVWAWPVALAVRTLGWLGRGVRGPLRDAMLAESVPAASRGRAFGFHRMSDTLGAIVGPLLAVGALSTFRAGSGGDPTLPFRSVFWLALAPGLAAALSFTLLVSERPGRRPHTLRFRKAVVSLPTPFLRTLLGVGVFGLGDFAPTLAILAATQLLSPHQGALGAAQTAGLLYVLRNTVYAATSFPIGALSDRIDRRKLLALGYVIGAVAALGLGAAFAFGLPSLALLVLLFGVSGLSATAQDTLERAVTADLVVSGVRGTGYGLIAGVNGAGDLLASAAVGLLWTLASPQVAFSYAGALMLLGAALLWLARRSSPARPVGVSRDDLA